MLNWIESAANEIWVFLSGLVLGVFSGLVTNWWTTWPTRHRRTILASAAGILALAALTPVVVDGVRDHLDTHLKVVLLTRSDGVQWGRYAEVDPGELLEYRLEITNLGPGSADGVVAGVNAPDYMSWVPQSTYIRSPGLFYRPVETSSQERGALVSGGIVIGDLLPESSSVVEWSMRVDDSNVFEKLGKYQLKAVGIGRVPGKTNEVYNTARVDVLIR